VQKNLEITQRKQLRPMLNEQTSHTLELNSITHLQLNVQHRPHFRKPTSSLVKENPVLCIKKETARQLAYRFNTITKRVFGRSE